MPCPPHRNRRNTYLASLTPGADIDHRGTRFTRQLLNALLDAIRDPSTHTAHFQSAGFDGAQFSGGAVFSGAQFSGEARFDGAQFSGEARFDGAQFSGGAVFSGAQFSDDALLSGAQFSRHALFGSAQFSGYAWFDRAQFSGGARFSGAQFSGGAVFDGAQFPGDAVFSEAQFSDDAVFCGARFEGVPVLGPLVCAGHLDLSGAVFSLPVTVEVAAREVVCARTRWESTAIVRLRYAAVDLSHAVLSAPVAVNAHATPFTTYAGPVSEHLLAGPDTVRVTSVQGVDAAHLVLTDTDITDCLFSGAFHLEQIRLEGRTTFAATPTGWHRHGIRPAHWTRRRTLAEEHHWRAKTAGQPTPSSRPGPLTEPVASRTPPSCPRSHSRPRGRRRSLQAASQGI